MEILSEASQQKQSDMLRRLMALRKDPKLADGHVKPSPEFLKEKLRGRTLGNA